MDDEAIVALYLHRNEYAIEATQQKYGHRLRSLAYGILQDRESAEECENDTYLTAWNSIPPHKPEKYLYPFLARIIRNLSLTHCSSRNCLKRSGLICALSAELEQCIPACDGLDHKFDEQELREVINGFLRTLPDDKRNVFVRRYWFLDSVEDISLRYRIS